MGKQNYVATAIIILVSASAFLAGFVQDGYLTDAAKLREEAAATEPVLTLMEEKAQQILVRDETLMNDARFYMSWAELLDIEWVTLNDTLTPAERQSYLDRIMHLLAICREQVAAVFVVKVYNFFEGNPSITSYTVADDLIDSSATLPSSVSNLYSIQKEDFQEAITSAEIADLNDLTYEFFGHLQLFDVYNTSWPFFGTETPVIAGVWGEEDDPSWFAKEYADEILTIDINKLRNTIMVDLGRADMYERRASRFNMAVSITTVMVLLATVMVDRIKDRDTKKDFEEIKHALKQDEQGMIAKPDYLSLPVLVF